MKTLKLVLAAALIITAATSCTKKKKKAEVPADAAAAVSATPTAAAGPKLNNSELKIGISQEFENFNPLIANMSATTLMMRMAIRGLDTIDADGKWVPQLAKSIPTLENGGAKKVTVNGVKKIEAVWEIQEGAVWGDGVPIICDDFAFAIKVAAAATVSVAEKETYTQIEKVTADPTNPKTFQHIGILSLEFHVDKLSRPLL